MDRAELEARDRADPLRHLRGRFELPDAIVYLDGNSLGPVARGVADRVDAVVRSEWREGLIRSWNAAGWVDLAERAGARIAPLVGADPDEVVVTDSTSVDLFKVLAAAARLRPDRRVLLTEEDNFPTDRYVAEGLAELLGPDRLEVRAVPRSGVASALDEEVAALFLTHVDYRTGERHDAEALSAAAHDAGALAVWDLSHSAGALAVDVHRWEVDLAVGCSYKFLNGGPGAPAYLYVARRHADAVRSPIAGWWGHARPFDFIPGYEPAPGVRRLQAGTPPILSLSALDAVLDVWAGVAVAQIEEKAAHLTNAFIELVDDRCGDLGVTVVSPREAGRRGAQVTLRHEHAYPVMQALLARGVIGDVRPPDLLRFGFAPAYVGFVDVWDAVAGLAAVLESREWDRPAFHERAQVT